MLKVPLIIIIGLLPINANTEQHTTTEIVSENSTSSLMNETISKDSNDDPNAYSRTTTESASKIIHIQRDAFELLLKESTQETRKSDSDVDLSTDSELKQKTESYKDIDGKDANPVDSNTTSVATTKRFNSETHEPSNTRRFNLETDSETENLNLNDTKESQNTTNIDKKIEDKSNNESDSGNTLLNLNSETNTEKPQVSRISHTDNVYKPVDKTENNNETISALSRDADDHNSNTQASNETKNSDLHLEPNTEISQVNKNHTDNVYKPFENEEKHNETEPKISRVADDPNLNTEILKELNFSDPYLETNTDKNQVYRRSYADNVYKPLDNEENHNEKESKISRNADDHHSNIETSKEFTFSDPFLEPDTDEFQVYRRSYNDNVYKPLDNEENHNETEFKISRDADDHYSNTEASKESTLSDPYLDPNTDNFQVYRRSYTDNVYKPLDNEENHNETESKISIDADDHYSNIEASKESNNSDPHVELNAGKSEIYSRNHTENVYKPLDNKENYNDTESKISRNVNDHNLNTEASKESKISDVNEDVHQNNTSKHDGNTQGSVNYDNERSDESKAISSDIPEVDSNEFIENNKNNHTVDAVFTSRRFNDDNSKHFNETNLNFDDSGNCNETTIEPTDQPTTSEDNNYDLVRRDGFTRRNLNYDLLREESTANQAKPNDRDENNYYFELINKNENQRNEIDDDTIEDTVQPIETAIDSEEVETVLSRSGRPDGGYISAPYDESRELNLIKLPPKADFRSKILNTKLCCLAIPSPQNYEARNSFFVHPIYGKFLLPFNSQRALGKIISDPLHSGNEYGHHYLFPRIEILPENHVSRDFLHPNYENRDAWNLFRNNAYTDISPGRLANHGNKIANPENHEIVFANRKNPLTNHEMPLPYYRNSLTSRDALENYENSLINHNYAKHENQPVNYGYPLENHENPLTNYGNPHSIYENPHRSNDLFTNYRNPLENHENPLINHGKNYAIHENLPMNYGNPHSNYEDPLNSHDPFTNLENPVTNYKYPQIRHDPFTNQGNPSASHGNYPAYQAENEPSSSYNHYRKPSRAGVKEIDDHDTNLYPRAAGATVDSNHQVKQENPTTNQDNPYSNYENILRSNGQLTKHKNPLVNHENPAANLGKSFKNNGSSPSNPENPLSRRYFPKNHGNPTASYRNPSTSSENPSASNGNPSASNGNPSASNGNNKLAIHWKYFAQQPDYAPFYNNFRHHSSDDEINEDRIGVIDHQTNRTINQKIPVPSGYANGKPNPSREVGQRFPLKAVPFRTFFL